MTVRIFKSTDVGAPQVQNAAGQLLAVLSACLVDGFAARTCTITRSGAVATVTQTAHGYEKNNRVLIAGAGQAEYNGDFAVASVIDANTFTYAVSGTPVTPATGTITANKSGAGWTKPYTGTNLAAFKQPAALANPVYLRVDDTTGVYATARGYEAMTAISTGTGEFPTTAQRATPVGLPKATTAVNAPWVLAVSDGTFWYWCNTTNSADGSTAYSFGFGDLLSYKSGDLWNKFIMGSGWTGAAITYSITYNFFTALNATLVNTPLTDHYLARSYTQSGTALQNAKVSDASKAMGQVVLGGAQASTTLAYPHPVDSGLYLAPVFAYEPGAPSALRGEYPGLWNPLHQTPLNVYDTFSGVVNLAGKEFMALKMMGFGSSSLSELFIETSDTW